MEEIIVIILLIVAIATAITLAFGIFMWLFAVPVYLCRIATALERIAKK